MSTIISEGLRKGQMAKITQHCMSDNCWNVIERVKFQQNGRCQECKKKQTLASYQRKKKKNRMVVSKKE